MHGKARRPEFLSHSQRERLNQTDASNKISRSSKLKYKSGVKRFLRYCEERNLDPIPTESNLSHFVSEISREIQPSSVNAYLTGISYHLTPSYPEAEVNRMSEKVRNIVKGCKRSFSKPIKRANAMLLSDIDIIASHFKHTYDDLLFNAIIAMGFNGLHRLGELVESDREELRDDRRLIKRWSFTILGKEEYASYALPCSKTDYDFSGTPVIIHHRPGSPTCPVQTLMKYVVVRDSAFIVNPFLLVRSNGHIPTRSWFMKRLQEVFGVERSGHSMRAGGATSYAQAGVRLETIQRIGRWKSDAFESYIRGHPLLNLLSAQQETPSFPRSEIRSQDHSSYLPGKLILLFQEKHRLTKTTT